MIRTTASPRPSIRVGAAALVGVAGAFALAACSAPSGGDTVATDAGSTGDTGSTGTGSTDTADTGDTGSTGGYADGTYTADGSYATPESVETIEVTVTLADGVITGVDVVGSPQRPESQEYQSQFIGGISAEVVGRPIDEIEVSRVAGSSLTSGGFNDAIEQIKVEAAV